MKQLTMIIFSGIQASGKTTFYHNFLQETYEHVSLDVLNTRNKERLAIEHYIQQEKNLVIDNTNPTKEDRARYITMAKAHNYQVIGYYFESSIGKCIERNEKRMGKAKVPRCAVISTSKRGCRTKKLVHSSFSVQKNNCQPSKKSDSWCKINV